MDLWVDNVRDTIKGPNKKVFHDFSVLEKYVCFAKWKREWNQWTMNAKVTNDNGDEGCVALNEQWWKDVETWKQYLKRSTIKLNAQRQAQ